VFVEKERHSFGRFVLATNNMDLNPNSIFKYYKEMLKVRNCYRFIHDNELCITEPLFKNDERIKGVSCFISFIILISSLLEFMLRSGLKRNGATILNAVHKTTYFPTLSYVFDRFDTFCGILLNEKVTRIVNLIFPINGHTDLLTILGAFGDDYVNFYKYNSGDVPFDEAEFIVRNLYDGSDE
jgi:transposase